MAHTNWVIEKILIKGLLTKVWAGCWDVKKGGCGSWQPEGDVTTTRSEAAMGRVELEP